MAEVVLTDATVFVNMGLFTRFFVQEIETLKSERDTEKRWRDWFEARANEAGEVNLKLQAKYDAEVRRNRKREDDLFNQKLRASGGKDLPAHDPEPKKEVQSVGFTQDEMDLFRQRAEEVLPQILGRVPTAAELNQKIEAMKQDPGQWLSDR